LVVLFDKVIDGTRYRVNQAGRSRRLYTDGAFHSQYNPGQVFAGGVWDALAWPALLAPAPPRSAIVLGVGGGGVMHLLKRLIPGIDVTGVEQDPVHIDLARRFFDINDRDFTIVEGDAVAWMRTFDRKVDLIVDDLFAHDLSRPAHIAPDWHACLSERLHETRGVLVQNYLELPRVDESIHDNFGTAFTMTTTGYDNHVLGLLRARIDLNRARQRVRRRLPRSVYGRLRLRCHRLR
jgi:predicted membrane-bound spermidine synthase